MVQIEIVDGPTLLDIIVSLVDRKDCRRVQFEVENGDTSGTLGLYITSLSWGEGTPETIFNWNFLSPIGRGEARGTYDPDKKIGVLMIPDSVAENLNGHLGRTSSIF